MIIKNIPDEQLKYAILIGSASHLTSIETQDRIKVSLVLSTLLHITPHAVFFCRRCFIPDIGFDGTAFASGETCILLLDGKESVVQINGFWSVRHGDKYVLLGYGVSFDHKCLDNGHLETHYWSGFSKVLSQPSSEKVVFNVNVILRKVILYPSNLNTLTVVDYMRQLTPSQLTVPAYPEKGDMVLIQGEQIGDVWYGHIQSVDTTQRSVEVYFFIPSQNNENIYKRETHGRNAKNTVSWDSIIGISQGHWRSQSSWVKSI